MHFKKSKKCLSRVLASLLVTATAFGMQPAVVGSLTQTSSVSTVKAASAASTKNADTFSWDNANVYFLLTDRFENGNKSNDNSYGRGMDQNGNVVSYSDTSATFHGGDFAGITNKIKEGYFNKLGVNALWISAPYEQIHGYVVGGDGSESFAHYAYHGYYVLDYTNTDANFGTKEEFQTLVDTAHEHGLRVVMDIVMNHAGYNSIKDMNEYNFGTLLDGWQDAYYRTSGINNATYHGVIDYTNSAADWARWWGPDWIRCGVAGYTEGSGSNQTMCLSGLPDYKTETTSTVGIPAVLKTKWTKEGRYNEEVSKLQSYLSSHNMNMTPTNCITYWLQNWVRTYGVDGFRCDTAKHVDLPSWKTLKTACVEALKDWKSKHPSKALDDNDFWMTGEVWDHGVYKDGYYTEGGFDSLINFSTQGAGILSKNNVAGTYQGFADSINSDPDFNVLSYISSHDSVLCRGNSIYNGSAFLLCPGAVQIFYGDETDRPVDSSAQSNGQHNLRCDMNWDSMNETTLAHWQKVGTFRNSHISVGAGQNTSLTASNGVAFSRTYSDSSKDISDKIAACIGCDANKNVTIDVSSLWADGQYLQNAYDYSSAVVTDGKVTFNSGANGTILIEEPDGKPLASVTGESRFLGTQQVTLHLQNADSAKVSVDGAHKFIAHDGDTFTIGETAYDDDTVKVQVEATNENGTRKASFSFQKVSQATLDEEKKREEEEAAKKEDIIYVKSDFTPYVYAWKGESTALAGTWPGTKMTEKTDDGYYVLDLKSTDEYNVVLNSGSGKQTKDITGLHGAAFITLNNDYSYTVTKNEAESGSSGSTSGSTTPTKKNTFTFNVSSCTGAAPCLYIWDNDKNTYNGGFPGNKLTEKSGDYYTLTVNSDADSLNCIVNYGNSSSQSGDITGITGSVTLDIKTADCKTVTVTKSATAESHFAQLKTAARAIKNMSAEDFTASTFTDLKALIAPADAIIAQGEDNADASAIDDMIAKIAAAKADLQVAVPVVNALTSGSKTISGTAAYESKIIVTVNGTSYETTADDVTGEWSVDVSSLKSGSSVKITSVLDSYKSNTVTKTIG